MFYGSYGTHYWVKFQIFLYFGLSSNTCGIHQIKFKSKSIIFGIDTISCSSGNIGYDVAILSYQCIDKGRFSCIGPTYYRETGQFVFLFFFFREYFDKGIQQLTCTATINTWQRIVFAQSQGIEFHCIGHSLAVINLVHGQKSRLVYPTQQFGNIFIHPGYSGFNVNHKNDGIGLIYGQFNLFIDFLFENIVAT